MGSLELAQLNIAELVAPLDSEELSGFVANLERINALADAAPGFVWRLQTEDGDATGITDFGSEFIVNMSVWTDMRSLHNFVYRSDHAAIMRRRREWFERMKNPYSVLWWVEKGHRPTIAEAKVRLELLRTIGPSPKAFTFKRAHQPPASYSSRS